MSGPSEPEARERLSTASLRRQMESAMDSTGQVVLDELKEQMERSEAGFIESMDDDFNTPEALAVLFDLVRELNKYADREKLDEPGVFQWEGPATSLFSRRRQRPSSRFGTSSFPTAKFPI